MRCLLASGNRHKVEEFSAAFKGLGIRLEVAPHALDVVEDGESFLENAALKARAYAKAFGQNALADDSGLSVVALGGAPGIHSARYAEPVDGLDPSLANNEKLLSALGDLPTSERTAYFSCALCLVLVEAKDLFALKRLPRDNSAWRFWDKREEEVDVKTVVDGFLPSLSRAELSVEARAYGHILSAARGEGGFGYDPLFYSSDCQKSFAQLSRAQKLALSHRGKAIAAFVDLFSSVPTCEGLA